VTFILGIVIGVFIGVGGLVLLAHGIDKAEFPTARFSFPPCRRLPPARTHNLRQAIHGLQQLAAHPQPPTPPKGTA